MNSGRVIGVLGALCEGLQRDPRGTTVSVRAKAFLPFIDGYVVGGLGRSLVLTAATPPNFLAEPAEYGSLVGWLRDLPEDTQHVGAWLYGDQYHFDAVNVYSDINTAIKIAKERNEIAIWDGYRQDELIVSKLESED